MPRRRSFGTRVLLLVLPVIVSAVLRLLGATWRVHIHGWQHVVEAKKRGPLIACAFHGRLLPLLYALGRPSQRRWRVLISASTDGEFIARVAHRLDFDTARGSSGRGGDLGYRELVRSIRQQPEMGVGFLVDGGSRGPRGTVKPGAIRLASATRGSLVPILTASDRCWIATKSWDRFQIPKPFARVRIVFLPPQSARGGGEVGREAARQRLEQVMVGTQSRLDRAQKQGDRVPLRAADIVD